MDTYEATLAPPPNYLAPDDVLPEIRCQLASRSKRSSPTPPHIDLEDRLLSCHGAEAVVQALVMAAVRGTDVCSVDLSENFIGEAGGRALEAALPSLPALTRLVLFGNPVHDLQQRDHGTSVHRRIQMQLLQRRLAAAPVGGQCDLSSMGVGDEGVAALLAFVAGGGAAGGGGEPRREWRSVNLSHNEISDAGAAALAEAMTSSERWGATGLVLRTNSIGRRGGAALQRAVLANPRVLNVDLRDNFADDELGEDDDRACEFLHQAIQRVLVPRVLLASAAGRGECSLAGRGLRTDGIRQVAQFLSEPEGRALTKLDLGAGIGREGYLALEDALATNYTLSNLKAELRVSNNARYKAEMSAIYSRIQVLLGRNRATALVAAYQRLAVAKLLQPRLAVGCVLDESAEGDLLASIPTSTLPRVQGRGSTPASACTAAESASASESESESEGAAAAEGKLSCPLFEGDRLDGLGELSEGVPALGLLMQTPTALRIAAAARHLDEQGRARGWSTARERDYARLEYFDAAALDELSRRLESDNAREAVGALSRVIGELRVDQIGWRPPRSLPGITPQGMRSGLTPR